MSNSSVFNDNESNKDSRFQKNERLNQLISEMRELLTPAQEKVQQSLTENRWPVSFIVGNPRSGSTLLLQWLASTGQFSYPTNLLNRFAYAPYVGALIQNLLMDKTLDFNNELSDIQSDVNFNSDLGKSSGALATNEFQHFLRNHMANFDPEHLRNDLLAQVDFKAIRQGLASLEKAFEKPFTMKATMLQYNIEPLFGALPNSIFLYIYRNPLFIMQSIFTAREQYYNDRSIWWSVKPKEYEFLKEMDVYHQIAGQVYYTEQSISKSLNSLPQEHVMVIDYEALCAQPNVVFSELKAKYQNLGYEFTADFKSEPFNSNVSRKISKEDWNGLEKAYNDFSSEAIKLL